MSAEPQLSRRSDLIWGMALVVIFIILCSLMYLEPQKLKAPAWVAYCAATAFFIAGLLLLARATSASRAKNWLAAGLVLAIVLPGIWVAFGAGDRQCTSSLPFLQFALEALCRSAFGIGALLGVGILVLYVRHAIANQRDR